MLRLGPISTLYHLLKTENGNGSFCMLRYGTKELSRVKLMLVDWTGLIVLPYSRLCSRALVFLSHKVVKKRGRKVAF